MNFKRELAQDAFDEMLPLFELHWKEIAHYTDIPLDPDKETYFKMEDAGMLRVFTARTSTGKLIGYAVFFIRHNLHYRSSLMALQDILFVHPLYRGGRGAKFIMWCDEQLKAEGVQISCQHIKAAHNFGPMLERMGYELVDLIYLKRLDRTSGVKECHSQPLSLLQQQQ